MIKFKNESQEFSMWSSMNENEDFKAHYRWHSFVLIAQFTNVDNLNRLSVSIFCLVQRLQHALFNHIPPTESKSEPFSHAQIEKYPLSVSSSLIGIKTLFSEMFRDEKWNFDWTKNKPCNKHKLAFYPTLRGRERASETNVCRISVDVKEAKRRIDGKLPNQKRFTILYGSFDLRTNGINEDQITISFHLTFATSNARYLSFYSMLKRESCASFVFSTQPELSTFNGARYINCYHCH